MTCLEKEKEREREENREIRGERDAGSQRQTAHPSITAAGSLRCWALSSTTQLLSSIKMYRWTGVCVCVCACTHKPTCTTLKCTPSGWAHICLCTCESMLSLSQKYVHTHPDQTVLVPHTLHSVYSSSSSYSPISTMGKHSVPFPLHLIKKKRILRNILWFEFLFLINLSVSVLSWCGFSLSPTQCSRNL